MDEAHLYAAFRYVAMKPVKARLVERAADWAWSSTSAHLAGRDDGLVQVKPLLQRVENVGEFFGGENDPVLEQNLMKGQSIGRPLLGEDRLIALEKQLGTRLRPGARGRPKIQNN